MPVTLAPSILASDFGRLAEEVRAVQEAGADWIHVDVMDGHFVPNISLGPAITRVVRQATDLPLDVHLMIQEPDRYLEAFADAGADVLTVHQEVTPHLHRTVDSIRELGVRPGVALNPATPVSTLSEAVQWVDLVLVMSVNPGFGGQSFIPATLGKLSRVRALVDERSTERVEIEVDGGVSAENSGSLVAAGATVLVAGSSIFGHPRGPAVAVPELRDAAAG
jgi:ribulose-phosphate 3-epimerase